jgi:hypothetical protein
VWPRSFAPWTTPSGAHPEAGALLRDLRATGEIEENEDVARMIGCDPFDTSYLVEQFLGLE